MKKRITTLGMVLLSLCLAACQQEEEKGQELLDTTAQEVSVQDSADEENTNEKKAEEEKQEQVDFKEKAAEPLTIYLAENYLDEWQNSMQMCEVFWQEMELAEESAKQYPKLAQLLQERNAAFSKENEEIMEELSASAREAYPEQEYFHSFYSHSQFYLQRADNHILSIREEFGDYSGGVHGYHGSFGINYDPATGEEVEITDVLTDISQLPLILSEKIMAEYEDTGEPFTSLQEYLEKEYKPEDYQWTMDYQGITFYFNPYEIASYAAGVIHTTLWFDENPELFREEYLKVPKNGYITALPLGHDIAIDLVPGDGKRDRLSLISAPQTAEEEESDVNRLLVRKNGLEHTLSDYGYSFDAYLVSARENEETRNYLYIESVQENDYRTIHIFDLQQEELEPTKLSGGVGFSGYWDQEAERYGYPALNDPDNLILESRLEILGTWSGIRSYTVDPKTGIPKAKTPDFDLSYAAVSTTSLIPLEVTILPGEEKEELPAGTRFSFQRTDGESYVDMLLEDGRECRIGVVFSDGAQSVNGIDQWECFSQLLYAG